MWGAVTIQGAGLVFDVVWHGLLNPDFHAVTVAEMVRHLRTVHLPIYIGAIAVFLSTGWAFVDELRRSDRWAATPIAFAGAGLSVAGEAWHAYHHLQLSTHSGAVAGMTSVVGLIVVVVALLTSGHGHRLASDSSVDRRRAA